MKTQTVSAFLVIVTTAVLGLWTSPAADQLKDWFGSPVHTLVEHTPKQLATGDFNGDGFVDIAVVVDNFAQVEGWLYILLGDGSPHFVMDQVLTEGNGSGFMTLDTGYLNDDDDLDIISGDAGESEIRIRYNDGNGGFDDLQVVQARFPWLLRIGDLDGDGFNDIVGFEPGRLWIHWGTSDGPGPLAVIYGLELGEPGSEGLCNEVDPVAAYVVDLTGDTRNDVLFIVTERNAFPDWCGPDERALGLLRNLGNRQFAAVEWLRREPLGDEWEDLEVIDLDDDEDSDVVITEIGFLRTFFNDGSGNLEQDTSFGSQAGEDIAIDDFNGDDTLDIAWSWPGNDADIFRGIGNNEYSHLESLGEALRLIHATEIDEHPGPELIGFNGGGLTVVPNISYLAPAGVDERLKTEAASLQVSPSILHGGGCSVYLNGPQPAGTMEPVLEVIDVTGRVRRTLTPPTWPSRDRPLRWDGTDRQGERLSSGVYFVRMQRLPYVLGRFVIAN